MDKALANTISKLPSFAELRQIEVNVRARDAMSDEIGAAIHARRIQLGRAFIAEKTGLNLDALSPAEEKIVHAVSEYVGVLREKGKYPGYTLKQLTNRGLLGAAEEAVCQTTPTQGFQTLADADLQDLSYEKIVLDHAAEFSSRAVWFARKTLGLSNTTDVPPAKADGDTQSRTATLLTWLSLLAAQNSGVIPAFTNADAAAAMGMNDMQRYGQVHGNIQSRIDFACFLSNLPPLGLAAVAPFGKAWAQQERSWAFPVESMQLSSKTRMWSAEEFANVLRQTELLPGQAHVEWKRALAENEGAVKAWAYSFEKTPTFDNDLAGTIAEATRNPAWSRDELILALELYLRNRASPAGKDSPEVFELSNFLGTLGRALGQSEATTYRNTNGVYMKMMNFRRLDPDYIKDGRVGLTRGNQDEQVVWDEFAHDPERLSLVVSAIRLAIGQHSEDNDLAGMDEPDICEAEEGRVLTRVHRVRERSRKLIEQAKKAAMQKHGRLTCEACSFDFSIKYGPTAKGFIDIHHTKPVHTLVAGDKTKVEDLVLLCPNCHRVVHSSRPWLTIPQLKALLTAPTSPAL